MDRITLKHIGHVVEVNDRVTDGNSTHFARAKSSLGDQAPHMAKSINSNLHLCFSRMLLAVHKNMQLFDEWGGAESLNYLFSYGRQGPETII